MGDEGKSVLISNATLMGNPSSLLGMGDDVTCTYQFRGDRFLNPQEDVPVKGGNWARYGWAWSDLLPKRNVGLYGHVVKFIATSPQTDFLQCPQSKTPSVNSRDFVQCAIDVDAERPQTYYKIEYWQFFGYNGDGKPSNFGDHEADWTTVQVIIDAQTLQLIQIHHFFHGYRAGFDLRRFPSYVEQQNGSVREYHGSNWGKGVQLTWYQGPVADRQNETGAMAAQNNVVRVMQDRISGQFTHPVVYVEHGGHEFWPTEAWGYQDAPNHNGADMAHSYLTSAPPNLGEVEHPLTEVAEALLILRYNGHWGAYSNNNSPPQGPPLHNQWTWPASSSIRWLLPKNLGN